MGKWTFLLCILLMTGCASASVETKQQEQAVEQPKEEEQLSPEEEKEKWIAAKLDAMTIEEKVGQLFILAFRTDEDGTPITEINDSVKMAIEQLQPGGIVLFGENIDSPKQVKKLIADMAKQSKEPMFFATDEEGGRVSRLNSSEKMNTVNIPPAGQIGATGDTAKAREAAGMIAGELLELGMDVDFAPIADINTNPDNPVIGDRAFGTEPNQTADMMAAFIQGLQGHGVSATAKHFPGHGDTSTDTHKGETFVEHDRQRLEEVEFIPFRRAIAEGVDFIMVAHIKTPNVTTDGLPASLSKEMITDILRNDMGYQGIVITDAMDMGAVVEEYGSGEAAVMAVEAGADIVLMPLNAQEAYESVLQAAEDNRISAERLEESVRRILDLKYKKGYYANENQ